MSLDGWGSPETQCDVELFVGAERTRPETAQAPRSVDPLCSRDSLARACEVPKSSQPLSSTLPHSLPPCVAPTSARPCPMSLLYALHSCRRRASSSSHLVRSPPSNPPSRVLSLGSPLARNWLRWAASYALIALKPAAVVSFQAQVTHTLQTSDQSSGRGAWRAPLHKGNKG